MEKVEVIKADFDWIKVGERYFRETFPERGGRVRDIGDKVEYSYGTQTATISKDDLSEWIWDKLSNDTTKEIEIDWVEYGKTYFKVLLGADLAVDVAGDSVSCTFDGTTHRVSKSDLSSWKFGWVTQNEIAMQNEARLRREEQIGRQLAERGLAERFDGTDYFVPPPNQDTAHEWKPADAPRVRPLLVVSFRESFTPAMSEVFKRNTKGIGERCGWVVVAVDCQDEAKVQAFAPGLPDINAMDTDEAITMLEALLEGLKRGRGDGGG